MALQSAFKERFEDMESTRNKRICLLQGEKELQKNKSVLLSAKHSNISLLEQRCLILDQRFASDNFRISSLKSEIEFLDRKFECYSKQLRDLKGQVDALQQLDTDREKCYAKKSAEMKEFTDKTQNYASCICIKVEELKRRQNELKLLYSDLQNKNVDVQNLDIQAAEIRNSELLALKQTVAKTLECSKRERAELEKQLQSLR